jgi:uroporphyrinogen-III synthase
MKGAVVASIGPITAETARQLGIPTQILPKDSTIPAFVDAICRHFERRRAGRAG